MARSVAGRIIAGLKEFNRKLRDNLPIPATRVTRCECRGSGCSKCKGTGYVRHRVLLK